MKNKELLNTATMIGAIAIVDGDKKLESHAAIDVALAQAECERGIKDFNEKWEEVRKKLITDDYKKKREKYDKMNDILDREKAVKDWNGDGEEPKLPTDEELKEAEELGKELEGFEDEDKELNKQLKEAHAKLLEQDCSIKKVSISRETWMRIYEMVDLNAESEISINNVRLTNREFVLQLAKFVA